MVCDVRGEREDSALLASFDYDFGLGRAYNQASYVVRGWCMNMLCNSVFSFLFALWAVKLVFGVGALTVGVWREQPALVV